MPPGILHHFIGWNIERKEIFVNDTNCSAFIADREFGLVEISLGSGMGAIMRLDKKQVVNITGDVTGWLANDVIKEND